MNYKKLIAPSIAVIVVVSGSIFFYRANKKLKQEYNELVDDYNELLEENNNLDALVDILRNDVEVLAAENIQLSADNEEVQTAYDEIRGHEIEPATGEEVVDDELAEMRKRYAAGPAGLRQNNERGGSKPSRSYESTRQQTLSERLRANLNREQEEQDAAEVSMQLLHPKEHREIHNARQAKAYSSVWETEVVLDPSDDSIVDHEEWKEKRDKIRKEAAMQHDINSEEALEAYKNMMLIEYRDVNFEQAEMQADVFRLQNQLTPLNFNQCISALDQLFGFVGYSPSNEWDQNAFEWALSTREEFFTPDSKYAQPEEISFAEILIYWVNQVQEDYEYEHLQWAYEFMNNINIFDPENTVESISNIISAVLDNDYYTAYGTFGLFGLNENDDTYGAGPANHMFNQMQTYESKLSEYLDAAQIGFQDPE